MNPITIKDIELFIKHPHVFGHFIGYPDLIDIHSEWIKHAWILKTPSLQAHRNSYKTTSILIIGAIWYLLFVNPHVNILIIRKSEVDAQRIIKSLKSHFESEKIQLISDFLYGVKDLKTDNWSNSSITISISKSKSPEGSIDSKGTTSAVTGSHYDFIMPDDIITIKDRVSRAERDWIKDFVRELKNIKKTNGKIFFSGTPWHKLDAWSILPDPIKYQIGTLRIKGFMPHEMDSTVKELKRGNTMSMYSANYELVHISDDQCLFPEPIYGDWPERLETRAYLDPAYSGDNYTAMTVYGNQDGLYYARGYTWRENIVDLYDRIVDILKQHNCGTLTIESNADKGLSRIEFEKRWPAVKGYNEYENKHIRIMTYAVAYFNQLIWNHNTDINYMVQVLDYQEGQEPDDCADSLAGAVRDMGFVRKGEVDIIAGVA